jgi:surfactin synthase thioesterase subunit
MRLFCFHHAGGGGAMFNSWRRALGPRIEVIPVDVDHHDRFATLRQFAEEVNAQLGPRLDGPHAFFGHSFGALVAYRLTCLRAAAGLRVPRALLLSSSAPPHLPVPIPDVDDLDTDRLAALLSDLGGIPPELTEWPALRDKAVAKARTDLRLCMTDRDAPADTLPCPIHTFGGSDDPLVSEPDLCEWRSRTSDEFSMQIFEGGHFYLADGTHLFASLRPLLTRIATGT